MGETPSPHPDRTGRDADRRSEEMAALRRLLFHADLARLDALHARLGADTALERAVAEVLPGALAHAGEERGRELAQAIGPTASRALALQSRADPTLVADALRPVASPLACMARFDLFERIDGRVTGWFGRANARAGRDCTPARVERILLLERESGLPVAHWRRGGGGAERTELMSGLIAAITAFARDALGERQLRALDFGERRVYLRMSGELIAAAQTDAPLSPVQERALGARFVELLVRRRTGAEVDEAALAVAAEDISQARAPGRAPTSWRVAQALALILCVAAGAFVWRAAERARIERAVSQAVEQFLVARPQAAVIPLGLAVDHGERRIELRLLVGSKSDAEAVWAAASAAAGGGYVVVTRLAQSQITLKSVFASASASAPKGAPPQRGREQR